MIFLFDIGTNSASNPYIVYIILFIEVEREGRFRAIWSLSILF
jgi:hypothetical protein